MNRRSLIGGSVGISAWGFFGGAAEAENTGSPAAAPPRFRVAGRGFDFETGALRGSLCKEGRALGLLPLADSASGTDLARSPGIFSVYRFLDSGHRYMPDGRDWTCRTRLLDEGSAEVLWAADETHPFDLSAVYHWRDPATARTRLVIGRGLTDEQAVAACKLFLGGP